MEIVIICILSLLVLFLGFWVRNLIVTQKRAAETVLELQDILTFYSENSLNNINKGNALWMHDPTFKYFKQDTEFVVSRISKFKTQFFDAIEVKTEKNEIISS